jgi:hypothetical protein
MEVQGKTGAACLVATIAVGASLLGFGLSKDFDAPLRDAGIELEMLHKGPTRDFQDYCRDVEASKAKTFRLNAVASSKVDLEGDYGFLMTTPDLEVETLLWCPFPRGTSRLKTVVERLRGATSSTTLRPNHILLTALGATARVERDAVFEASGKAQPERDALSRGLDAHWHSRAGGKFRELARQIAGGGRIRTIALLFDPKSDSGGWSGECLGASTLNEEDRMKLPAGMTIRVALSGVPVGSNEFCLTAQDIPVSELATTGSGGVFYFHREYFSRLVKANPRYSRPEEASTELQPIKAQEDARPDAEGRLVLNEVAGFRFPALFQRLGELGDYSVDGAYNKVTQQLAATKDESKILGMGLPTLPFLIVAFSSLPVLAWLFLASLKTAGLGAFPEVLRGLPPWVRLVLAFGGIAVLPALATLTSAFRVAHVLPALVTPLMVSGPAWCMLTGFVLWRRRDGILLERTSAGVSPVAHRDE